jgi:hypothetical protein
VNNLGTVAMMQQRAGVTDTVFDKFSGDEWADAYSDMLGVDPNMVVGTDKVAMVRKQRAQAQQAAQQAAVNQQRADTAAKLSQVPTQGGTSTAANDILGQFSGYGSPTPEQVGMSGAQ